jgi:hypothetical protein
MINKNRFFLLFISVAWTSSFKNGSICDRRILQNRLYLSGYVNAIFFNILASSVADQASYQFAGSGSDIFLVDPDQGRT